MTVWATDGDFELELRRIGKGGVLFRQRLERAHLQPLIDDALWAAVRRGAIDGQLAAESVHLGAEVDDAGRVRAFAVSVRGSSSVVTRYSTSLLRDEAEVHRERMVASGQITAADEIEFWVRPVSPQAAPPGPPDGVGSVRRATATDALPSIAALAATATVEQAAIPIIDVPDCDHPQGALAAWQRDALTVNAERGKARDPHVFALRGVLDQAEEYCRRPGRAEGAAMLVGRLLRQTSPEPEVFAVIEAAFEVQHAEQDVFRLEPTTASYVQLEQQIERRRRRLDRPEEVFIGIAHAHNFLPSVADDGTPHCPNCPKIATCPAHSAFYSADDVAYTRAFFGKQVFGIGVVFGLTPRKESVTRVFGFRDGSIQERSLAVVDAPPVAVGGSAPTSATSRRGEGR